MSHRTTPRTTRGEIQHALDALNSAMDKISEGDTPESDLLEVHACLDSLLADWPSVRRCRICNGQEDDNRHRDVDLPAGRGPWMDIPPHRFEALPNE